MFFIVRLIPFTSPCRPRSSCLHTLVRYRVQNAWPLSKVIAALRTAVELTPLQTQPLHERQSSILIFCKMYYTHSPPQVSLAIIEIITHTAKPLMICDYEKRAFMFSVRVTEFVSHHLVWTWSWFNPHWNNQSMFCKTWAGASRPSVLKSLEFLLSEALINLCQDQHCHEELHCKLIAFWNHVYTFQCGVQTFRSTCLAQLCMASSHLYQTRASRQKVIWKNSRWFPPAPGCHPRPVLIRS